MSGRLRFYMDEHVDSAITAIANLSELERSSSMDQTGRYQQALMDEVRELPEEAFPNLLRIVHLFKESVLSQSREAVLAVHAELAQWDRLSDEALLEFEKKLQG